MTAVLTQVDTRMPNRLQFKQALVCACLFGSFGLVSNAYAAQKVGAKVEAETVALPTEGVRWLAICLRATLNWLWFGVFDCA